MTATGIVYLIDTDTGKVMHTVYEAILHEDYLKSLERHYSNFFGKRLFAEIYSGSKKEAA